jgi:malto-oligosyltrehalose trehalohydrolase
VHAIVDDSRPDILEDLAEAVRIGPAAEREIHLVLENDHNAARYLRPGRDGGAHYRAQWNDDSHHTLHLLATGESDGYYADYLDQPLRHLARVLTEGFAYQGEPSQYRGGAVRGEPSGDLPPTAFVGFLQNHDQIGNRAFGERIGELTAPEVLRALSAVLLLAPSPPLLFMGQEFATAKPFLFFCDLQGELAQAVTRGRRREFARFRRFADPQAQQTIPDPNALETFEHSRIDWEEPRHEPQRGWLDWHRRLLNLRGRRLVPHLTGSLGSHAGYALHGDHGLEVEWELADGSRLGLLANLGDGVLEPLPRPMPHRRLLLHVEPDGLATAESDRLPPWSVIWWLQPQPRV